MSKRKQTTHYQKMKSIMRKCENMVEKQKEINKKSFREKEVEE